MTNADFVPMVNYDMGGVIQDVFLFMCSKMDVFP